MNENRSLALRYAASDLRRHRGAGVALLVVLILSTFLMATGSMVMERVVGSVDRLFDEAEPPHFLQMHKGDHDPEALARFADAHPEIEAWLVEEMLGFDGAAIAWHRPSTGESGDLSESLIDNLFVTQNREFDLLLDEAGAAARPARGEAYVPVAYQQRFGLQVGDRLVIGTDADPLEVRVEGFVRDAQMASSLSSATRFVLSDADFRALERAGGGAPEIIAEYRLSDPSAASAFQRAYEADEALPKNGQAVTFQMIRTVNALGDGLVAVALMFVSLLLIAISLLSVRFVIRGTLEDEVREIGAMKAIGLPSGTIAGLHLTKYRILSLLACVVGGILAVVATELLTRGIRLSYAEAPFGIMTVLVPVVAVMVVHLVVMGLCRGALRSVDRIEVVGALVHGSTLGERRSARLSARRARRARRSSIASYRGRGLGGRLLLLDLRAEGRQWALVPVVFFLATVLMTLPMNLLSTFESPRFVAYMGAPESDLRADLQFSDDLDTVRDDILSSMRADDRLTDVRAFANVLHEVRVADGWENLRVEVGDHAEDTVEFLRGGCPGADEIALSVLSADKHAVEVGDELTVRLDGEPAALVVSGVYQDVTSGGHTAKTTGEVTGGAAGYVVYANAVTGEDPAEIAADYDERFPAASVIPMREYMQQTLSHVTDALRTAAALSFVFALGVAALITTLFLRLRLIRERTTMGTLSAVGFSTREIIAQVRVKTLLGAIAGTGLGLVLAATAGESVAGVLISATGLGIADLAFIPDPLLVFAACPLALIGAGCLSAAVLTARLRGADTSSWLG
jgi:putative ABC transport system permease protein